MQSIRRYLVIIICAVVCLTNFSAALHGYRDSLKAAEIQLDHHVKEKLHSALTLVNSKLPIPEDLFNDNTLFQFWQGDSLVAHSSNASNIPLLKRDNEIHNVNFNGRSWRALGHASKDDKGFVLVAIRMDAYAPLTEEVLLRAIIPIIWVLPILAILVWLIIHIGLKPVTRLACAISHRDTNDFTQLKNKAYPDELVPIVGALNNLLSRLEHAFEHEKRFSADAAHELRTPLAVFKVNLHNLESVVGKTEELLSLRRAADRMEHSIEQLLALHRVSHRSGQEELESCDLHKIAQTVIADMYDLIDSRNQSITLDGTATKILANSTPINIMVRNLIDNASKHTPMGGTIRISTLVENDHSSFTIEDSGPGIPESEHSRVLDRFYRVTKNEEGDKEKGNKIIGSGLGLSIVAFVVDRYQGSIYFSRSNELGGLTVKTVFPSK